MRNRGKESRGKVAACVAAVAVALTGASWGGAQLRYEPVPGGYRTSNGDGEFNRPLYGWHGDDRELNPCKSLPWTTATGRRTTTCPRSSTGPPTGIS